jgi:hypothetical protein
MAQITLTIPNAVLQDVLDALAEGYQPVLPDGSDNPQTRVQFAKEQIRVFITQKTITYLKSKQTPPADPGITIS